MIFLGILVSFIIFSIIVLIHEYGHYKTARFFKIHIEEFGLGIPPRAKKLWTNKSGTLFSLNWIPLGGFVKIAGESEVHFNYFDVKGKKLTFEQLKVSIKQHEDIFDENKQKISKIERKYLKARLKNFYPGNNFFEKNIFQKSLVLLAGVIMNFILAGAIFSFLFFIGVQPVGVNTFLPSSFSSKLIPTLSDSLENGFIQENPGVVLFPLEGSLAEKAGIQNEDILLNIDTLSVNIEELPEYIQSKKGQRIELYLERKTACPPEDTEKKHCPIIEYKEIQITPDDDGKIGTYLAPNYTLNKDFLYRYPFGKSIQYGFEETYSQIRLTLSGLNMLGKNIFFPESPQERQDAIEKVSGPIGIVGLITDSLSGGIVLLLILGAIISVNLGVFNLLPIPALDGGRLLLLWIRSFLDMIIGKNTLSEKIENITHIAFFFLLIALSVIIAYNDIIKIFSD